MVLCRHQASPMLRSWHETVWPAEESSSGGALSLPTQLQCRMSLFHLQVSFLIQTCQMLVNMKRKELMYKARQRRAAAAQQKPVIEAKKDR